MSAWLLVGFVFAVLWAFWLWLGFLFDAITELHAALKQDGEASFPDGERGD